MKEKNYKQTIQETMTMDELNKLKTDFLLECNKREKRLEVGDLLNKINNFTNAKQIFESLVPTLMTLKEGKPLIKKYVSLMKENKSLKTIYAYYEGIKSNESSENKKNYITEALSIGSPIQMNEYVNGLKQTINLIAESFKLLGDDFILNNVKFDENSEKLNESLLYLSSTKKTIKNLNEYFNHINIVTENIIKEEKQSDINLDATLEELIPQQTQSNENDVIDSIFTTENKNETFQQYKNICLEMINNQKSLTQDKEVLFKLTEMENKLQNKNYSYDTFTKDVFYMKELQDVLK
jgi:hypothetical protein